MIIYKATNPTNNHSYIGETIYSLEKRKYQHIYLMQRGSNCYFHNALRKYGPENFTWEIIDRAKDIGSLLMYEIWYIDQLKPEYNMTSGGDGLAGHKFSEEHKKKLSLAKLGKPRSKKTRKKISISLSGRKLSEVHRQKLSLSWKGRSGPNLGHNHSEETKKKISNALKGHQHNLGRKHSEETKKKISNALKGRKVSEETKKKLSMANKGKRRYRRHWNDTCIIIKK